MPSTRPQAAFEPLAPNLDIRKLVESTPNFDWAARIRADMVDHRGLEDFERLVLVHVILGGKPLVIEGYEEKLDKWTFSVQWLRDNWGMKVVDARDLTAGKNVPLTIQHYLNHMSVLTNQWDEKNYKDKDRQRMYLKDIDCHPIWAEKVKDQIPFGMFYFNESVGDIGGLGAPPTSAADIAFSKGGRGAAKAGDLMSSLPKAMRAENLMCYIGHEGTYTPAHREMCATLGHNIMVEASTATIEGGKLTKPGSSIWFMTETKDREVVSEYWLSRLGHDIEIEKHFAQVNAWRQAPFNVLVVEQKVGDLILIPPLAPHQVWNRGTRTMKVAWNRTTVETLEMALREALPKARMVCRDEQYKNKAIIYFSLEKYARLLRVADEQKKRSGTHFDHNDVKVRQLLKDFKRLQIMFSNILLSESFAGNEPEKNMELVPFDSNITCSYCRCNIFNRFLTCPNCIGKLPNGEEDTYDICIDCYAMGRSCACISKLRWVEQWPWNDLTAKHERWRRQIIEMEGKVDPKLPKSLYTEISLLGKKRTLAQICQLELAKRPFHDIKKDKDAASRKDEEIEREEIDEVDANGNVRKKKKIRRSEKYVRENGRCHVDCYWEPKWKQATCSKCDKNFCYGNLFRAYDEMPQDIMANPDWKCPSCRSICGCRQCKHKPGYKQYTPKGTLLGHNTKAVADPRSVESLVDFSYPNLGWIQKAGDDHEEDTLRLRRRLRQAEAAKAKEPELEEEHYVHGEAESRVLQLAAHEGIAIDPALTLVSAGTTEHAEPAEAIEDEEAFVEHPEEPWWTSNMVEINDPQTLVPAGGIMWDNEHAYDMTDAITYVYPELGPPASQVPAAPLEGFAPTIIPGYEPAMPADDAERIEMVDRKRKRAKPDDGDRPYVFKKAMTQKKPKSRVRKSLVLKLAINKDRLRTLASRVTDAQPIQTDIAAPVVGSDLQALNLDIRPGEAPLATRKARPEDAEDAVDGQDDDDFTPSRYRDRRKANPDGAPRSPPGADITRRTTRMQAVRYLEPEEDDFNDTFIPADRTSKLATMQGAVQEIDSPGRPRPSTVSTDPKGNGTTQSVNISAIHKTTRDGPSGTQTSTQAITATRNAPTSTSRATAQLPVSIRRPSSKSISSSSTSSSRSPANTKMRAEVEANRKAKLAAFDGAVDFEENESTSDDDQDTSPPSTPEHATSVPQRPPGQSSTGSKAPRLSLPGTRPAQKPQPTPQVPSKPTGLYEVQAADWGDDSSDDDVPQIRPSSVARPSGGFHAVNGRVGHHIVTSAVRGSTGKRRGRPPRAR